MWGQLLPPGSLYTVAEPQGPLSGWQDCLNLGCMESGSQSDFLP